MCGQDYAVVYSSDQGGAIFFKDISLPLLAVSLCNSHKLEQRGHEMDKTEVGQTDML